MDAVWRTSIAEKLAWAALLLGAMLWWLQSVVAGSEHWTYWAQTLSGNWPGKPKDGLLYDFEYTCSVALALFLNFATIGAVVTGAIAIVSFRGRIMNTRDALALKDIVVQRNVFKKLAADLTSSEERDKIQEKVSAGFAEGERDFIENYLPIALPDKADRDAILHQIQSEQKFK